MSISVSTLRPGLLVNINTAIKGNVKYVKNVIESEHLTEAGEERATWETERTICDPKEYDAAVKVRSKARSIISSVCTASYFGMLCPEDKRAQLDIALAEANKLCDEFNKTATVTNVKFFAIAGRIAADDVEAVRAINSEVRYLIDEMQSGIEGLDVEVVRKAASRAKQLGNMLSPDAQARIESAVKAVREQAKKLVEAGEQAATAIDATTINKLAEARTAFLDLDPAAEVSVPVDTSGRALDLAPVEHAEVPAVKAPDFDLD